MRETLDLSFIIGMDWYGNALNTVYGAFPIMLQESNSIILFLTSSVCPDSIDFTVSPYTYIYAEKTAKSVISGNQQ